MKTTIKEITPQWASRILETRNPKNRNLSERYVERLAVDISNGAYLQTHQPIAFDSNGDLIDGQHRLMAVVRANKPITSIVVSDVPSSQKLNGTVVNTFTVIDTGRARRPSQMLRMEGYKYTSAICSMARSLFQMCSHEPTKNIGISVPTVKLILCACRQSIETIAETWHPAKIVKANSSMLSAIAFWHTTEPDMAEQFCRDASEVTGSKDSVTRNLAKWISQHPQRGGGHVHVHFYAASNAIMQIIEGRNLGKIYASPASAEALLETNPALRNKIASFESHYIA